MNMLIRIGRVNNHSFKARKYLGFLFVSLWGNMVDMLLVLLVSNDLYYK